MWGTYTTCFGEKAAESVFRNCINVAKRLVLESGSVSPTMDVERRRQGKESTVEGLTIRRVRGRGPTSVFGVVSGIGGAENSEKL